ncbi:unnamed protein product [Didymodactylos carnosus]|uniref:P/Homo B domain-containing protein n=1 Tax=Didymodactylos carnosus TaxID=1234261 RepID=A0A813WMR4_9BILA|nr:unnamed protein product [Didymodactylos carnosus]CAF0871983.1 unnamed protein product [Didymodactylos carnosus]CAF3645420.1 unnamed protein product [Didymodactylos carnosus]CAF3656868.1 unnamed protein product [Didymodactylos carnosus]
MVNLTDNSILICYCLLIYYYFAIASSFILTDKPNTIVIEVNGDCLTVGAYVAHLHGYRVVREIFPSFCEVEENPLSEHHQRHRRAVLNGEDPVDILQRHKDISWAEHQVRKIRQKREYVWNDPQWPRMWYLQRNEHTVSLPDLNVTGAWLLGYTGHGSVVTFLDDGLEYDHPDLKANYDEEASYDINDNDADPSPRYDPSNENKHGTRCAGEVAAMVNNSICGVGAAYHAKVGGIRMLDGDVTDSVEARSLSHRPDHVDIYSASWGPDDNGVVVDGPGRLAKKAFEDGAQKGRGGKGSIFVWASGNGGRQFDSCACDGYINSIYTISISATTERGEKPWYLEECSATLASAYSSGNVGGVEHDILTTDLRHECTEKHTGTSAAAPLAAAIIALALEANPNLTWRDVMHLVVLSSRPLAIPSNKDYVTNAVGFNVSSKFGFGLMDAGLMTWYAEKWINVPPMVSCSSVPVEPSLYVAPNQQNFFEVNVLNCKNSDATQEVNFIEQVQIFVSLSADRRGDIELYLYSPSGTKSQLLPRRQKDSSNKGFQDWPFLTVQVWGESPHGLWKLEVVNTGSGSARLISWRLVIHGTKEYPWLSRSTTLSPLSSDGLPHSCHPECKSDLQPCGPSELDCVDCRHYKQILPDQKFRCLAVCPDDTYPSSNTTCLPCHTNCATCRSSSETSCISCKVDKYLVHDTMTCIQTCPEAYYIDKKLRKCVRCKSDCLSCDNEPSQCTSCSDGYTLKDGGCLKAAKACESTNYYDFDANKCRWCDSRCLTCNGPGSDQCTSCNQEANSKYRYIQQHSCVKTCSPGYVLINNKCEKNAGKPFYIDQKTHQSHSCHSSCLLCNGSKPNHCIACANNKILAHDGYCIDNCPEGYYVEKAETLSYTTNTCRSCQHGCTSCTDKSTCKQCDWNYEIKNDQCYPRCGTEYVSSSTELDCKTCTEGFTMINNKCISDCLNDAYYCKVDKVCKLCSENCLQCLYPGTYCRDCVYPMALNMFTHRCLSCCLTNITDENCCQCPQSYDGLCLHPLVKPEISSDILSVLTKIQNKFKTLDHTFQTIIFICLLIFIFVFSICSICLLYRLFSKRLPSKHIANHSSNIQYKMLNNNDDIDEDDNEEQECFSADKYEILNNDNRRKLLKHNVIELKSTSNANNKEQHSDDLSMKSTLTDSSNLTIDMLKSTKNNVLVPTESIISINSR